MYIVVESLKNGPDDKETTVVGVHRQVKAASVHAWKLYFKEILKNVQHLSQKGNRLSIKYTILCWDERPEENTLIATWHLLWPSLERGKDKDKQQQTMSQHVKSVIAELDAGKVPNHLWNKYMSLAREGEGALVKFNTQTNQLTRLKNQLLLTRLQPSNQTLLLLSQRRLLKFLNLKFQNLFPLKTQLRFLHVSFRSGFISSQG